jgi:bacteriocin biosynthesis cyclodehydratase domain-containing protein
MRIQLKPGLQVVPRGPTTVQIGLDPRHGAVLDGLTDADHEVLRLLAEGVDDDVLTGPLPIDPVEAALADRVRQVVDTLAGTGTLLRARAGRAALARLGPLRPRLAPDAAAWSLAHPGAGDGWELLAARRARVVEVHGSGRTGAVLAATLAAGGVGRVDVRDDGVTTAADVGPGGVTPSDVGLDASDAAARAVRRALGRTRDPDADPHERRRPDLVVLVDRGVADANRADRLLADDVAHLSVVIRETSVVVGPLVLPGTGPCLRCLDLHRSERDRQWPVVLAGLLSRAGRRDAPHEETALAQLAAGLAALQVFAQVDGQVVPATVGATLEVDLPDGLPSRRLWPAHAGCGCHWPPGEPRRAQDGHDHARAGTMTS